MKNLKELREKQDEEKQDTVWLARYLNAVDDIEEVIRNRIKEIEASSNPEKEAQLNILKELLGE